MRTFLRRFILLSGTILAVLLLLSCLAYYVTLPPLFGSLSILVPYLVAGNLVFFLFWALRKRWKVLLPLLPLSLAFFSFGSLYQFSMGAGVGTEGLQVMTFNARSFSPWSREDPREAIVDFIQETAPDILCFQEFPRASIRHFEQYTYHYITPREGRKTTQAILSRYPILRQGQVLFPDSGNNTLYADIAYQGDTLRIYNVHLQSYGISSRSFLWRNFGLDFIERLQEVGRKHREQARLVRNHMETSPYPSLVCGDFNATAFSRSYRILGEGMQDSFRERGRGWGTTFFLNQVLPYRIDYILASPEWEILGHRNFDIRLSDHLPVMATLQPKGQ